MIKKILKYLGIINDDKLNIIGLSLFSLLILNMISPTSTHLFVLVGCSVVFVISKIINMIKHIKEPRIVEYKYDDNCQYIAKLTKDVEMLKLVNKDKFGDIL